MSEKNEQLNESKNKLNLWEKINDIQWNIIEIYKTGRNDFEKYDYKNFTDIKKTLAKKIIEHKITVTPGFLPVDQMNLHVEENKIWYNQLIEVKNAEEPTESFSFIFPIFGNHKNSIEQSHGKAITYALKSIFNLWALLPNESLDPDNEQFSEGYKEEKKQVKKQNSKKSSTPATNPLKYNKELIVENIQKFVKINQESKIELQNILLKTPQNRVKNIDIDELIDFCCKWEIEYN